MFLVFKYMYAICWNVGCELLTAVVMKSSGIQRRLVRWKSTDHSEKHIALIFRV
jgi:hypothetical protein